MIQYPKYLLTLNKTWAQFVQTDRLPSPGLRIVIPACHYIQQLGLNSACIDSRTRCGPPVGGATDSPVCGVNIGGAVHTGPWFPCMWDTPYCWFGWHETQFFGSRNLHSTSEGHPENWIGSPTATHRKPHQF